MPFTIWHYKFISNLRKNQNIIKEEKIDWKNI
jgi:hypothetical protein